MIRCLTWFGWTQLLEYPPAVASNAKAEAVHKAIAHVGQIWPFVRTAQKGDDVPVFSNEAGEALKTFKKAWVVAVLKAHGVDPRWRKGAYKDLSTDCQQRFRDINLHWHDLRHEYASRLVERGVPLAQVRDLLGHASIITTERYDNQRLEALQAAVERLEGGKTFDPKIDASDKVSRIFQDPTEQSFARSEDPAKESATSH